MLDAEEEGRSGNDPKFRILRAALKNPKTRFFLCCTYPMVPRLSTHTYVGAMPEHNIEEFQSRVIRKVLRGESPLRVPTHLLRGIFGGGRKFVGRFVIAKGKWNSFNFLLVNPAALSS